MNREILFRGKRIDNGEWAYGYVVEMCDESDQTKTEIWIDSYRRETKDTFFGIDGYTEYSWKVDHTTIGQYTGLTDKNGTKIFEQDVVKWDSKEWGSDFEEVVEWDYELFAARKSGWEKWCEVIGNIHDEEGMK